MVKRKLTDERRQLRTQNFSLLNRDNRHECRIGSVIEIDKKLFIVGMTTTLFVYVFSDKGIHKRLTWKEWEEKTKASSHTSLQSIDYDKLFAAISFTRKKFKFERRVLKEKWKKLCRDPKIKRTPVIKIKRTPVLKKKRRKKK